MADKTFTYDKIEAFFIDANYGLYVKIEDEIYLYGYYETREKAKESIKEIGLRAFADLLFLVSC